MTAPDLAGWFAELESQTKDRREATEEAHRSLRDSGLLPKVALHRYMCRRGCQLALVFRVGGLTLCAVRDYKLSPGLNTSESVEAARLKDTLDGDRHWSATVYDVELLADDRHRGMYVACRHYRGALIATDVLEAVNGVAPGRPRAPTRL